MSRFAIREATLDDAAGISYAAVESWQSSYRGILPDNMLDQLEVGPRVDKRKHLLRSGEHFHLVAYDVTHGDIVGFCDAGPARRHVTLAGEVYAIYLVHRAKRYGLGTEMFDRVRAWLKASNMPSMIVWVLENNHHARRFYEAMGGRAGNRLQTMVSGFPVIEQAYVWDHI